ncbi:MAG: transposase [Deltaproteobacteria bacterium]|nr:transposase [Deltaproteobacteria bacterium]MBW2340747.1 transposase [Deltaproteobacteria bacterium]
MRATVKAGKPLDSHLDNILACLKHHITNATVEGIHSKIQMIKHMACGFRDREHYKIAIYFHCGGLALFPRQEIQATTARAIAGRHKPSRHSLIKQRHML